MRFELIDRVIEQDDKRLVAIKNVTSAEEYLADHFPGFPVLPGVMMLETLVQAARMLLDRQAAGPNRPEASPWVLGQVRSVRYGNMVRPGQALRVEVTLRDQKQGQADFTGVGSVEEQVAVQGRFSLTPLGQRQDKQATEPSRGVC